MKPASQPKALIVIVLLTVTAAFLAGTFRLFRSVHVAAAVQEKTATLDAGAATRLPANNSQTEPQATPTPVPVSADTTGMIALAIVIVAIILVGATWGVYTSRPKRGRLG